MINILVKVMKNLSKEDEYNSNNTERFSIEQIKERLMTLEYVRKELSIQVKA